MIYAQQYEPFYVHYPIQQQCMNVHMSIYIYIHMHLHNFDVQNTTSKLLPACEGLQIPAAGIVGSGS